MEAGDRILLVIEDDPRFAKIVYDHAHRQAFKCLIAGDGRTGLELVRIYWPNAVVLDLNLPDISGWEVLDVLKRDPDTRHIPVHIMSVDEEVLDAYRKGAMGYLTKPTDRESLAESFQNIEQFLSREIKTLLLVEDDAKSRRSIKKLLGGSDVEIVEADPKLVPELGVTRLFDSDEDPSALAHHRPVDLELDTALEDRRSFGRRPKREGNRDQPPLRRGDPTTRHEPG